MGGLFDSQMNRWSSTFFALFDLRSVQKSVHFSFCLCFRVWRQWWMSKRCLQKLIFYFYDYDEWYTVFLYNKWTLAFFKFITYTKCRRHVGPVGPDPTLLASLMIFEMILGILACSDGPYGPNFNNFFVISWLRQCLSNMIKFISWIQYKHWEQTVFAFHCHWQKLPVAENIPLRYNMLHCCTNIALFSVRSSHQNNTRRGKPFYMIESMRNNFRIELGFKCEEGRDEFCLLWNWVNVKSWVNEYWIYEWFHNIWTQHFICFFHFYIFAFLRYFLQYL